MGRGKRLDIDCRNELNSSIYKMKVYNHVIRILKGLGFESNKVGKWKEMSGKKISELIIHYFESCGPHY